LVKQTIYESIASTFVSRRIKDRTYAAAAQSHMLYGRLPSHSPQYGYLEVAVARVDFDRTNLTLPIIYYRANNRIIIITKRFRPGKNEESRKTAYRCRHVPLVKILKGRQTILNCILHNTFARLKMYKIARVYS